MNIANLYPAFSIESASGGAGICKTRQEQQVGYTRKDQTEFTSTASNRWTKGSEPNISVWVK